MPFRFVVEKLVNPTRITVEQRSFKFVVATNIAITLLFVATLANSFKGIISMISTLHVFHKLKSSPVSLRLVGGLVVHTLS